MHRTIAGALIALACMIGTADAKTHPPKTDTCRHYMHARTGSVWAVCASGVTYRVVQSAPTEISSQRRRAAKSARSFRGGIKSARHRAHLARHHRPVHPAVALADERFAGAGPARIVAGDMARGIRAPASRMARHSSEAAQAAHSWGEPVIVSVARRYIGSTARQIGLPRATLWCATFMNHVLGQSGRAGTGSDLARSFLAKPRTSLHVGAIAVLSRRGGGHVGVVSGIDQAGNPTIISGNHGRRVAESVYPAWRVVAYVRP